MTPETVTRLRAETPACRDVLHFNNAGASLMPEPVFQTMTRYLDDERRMGGYEAGTQNQLVLDRFYAAFARLIGAEPGEIAYQESATRAWDTVLYGLRWRAGDEVIIHVSDYVSNTLALMQMAERRGIVISQCPSDAHGQMDVAALAAMIGARTRLVSVSHIPTQGGIVQPVAEIGRVARAAGVPFLLDACQSLGQVVVNVDEIGCDFLTGTGRKFLRGPRGTGVLYVRNAAMDLMDPPFVDGHSAAVDGDRIKWQPGARRFEAFEQNYAGKAGLAAAVDYALRLGMADIEARLVGLAAELRHGLKGLAGVTVHDQGLRQGGIVTFSKDGIASGALSARLHGQGINTSVSRAHWAPLDFAARGLPDMVRASVHAYNSEDEVARFVAAIAAA
ncbi:MAG: aminotransferase class V-fold PLP-dependent enzyme [Pseudomonadota bacterium]